MALLKFLSSDRLCLKQSVDESCELTAEKSTISERYSESCAIYKARISRGEFEEDCLFESVSTGYK